MTYPGGDRVWLLSAYRADSHGAWSDWLRQRMDHVRWQVLELPGRHFAWRIRGNPLSWLDHLPDGQPDGILATSMVDLATLKGLHPRLAGVPTVYYFHENQLAYPASERQYRSLEPVMVQIYGALAADRLAFNSHYNRDSFLEGLDGLLARFPDRKPTGLVRRLADKSQVLPVPVEPIEPARERDGRLVVWNHRWEYDKNPALFADAMRALDGAGTDFRLALLGPRDERRPHPALDGLRRDLPHRITDDGRMDADRYRAILARAGVVVSTAAHEFQGLSVLEAASAGARPLVPDGLCYREQYPDPYRYTPGDVEALVTRLRDWFANGLPGPADVGPWTDPALAGRWQALVVGLGG